MMKSIVVGGVRLAYRVEGEPGSPALVLLHGLGDSSQDWQGVTSVLAQQFRTFAVDLRGHGASASPGDYSFELMRDDVLGFLDAAGIERCVLVGHSMGAVVAALVATAAGERVSRLVLVDATPPRPGDLRRPPLTAPGLPPVVNAIRAQLDAPDPAWWRDMQDIVAPTLIVGGADSGIPHAMLAATADRMPGATLVTVAAGHNVHRDNPGALLAEIATFLQR